GGRQPAQYGRFGKQQRIKQGLPKAAGDLQGGGDGKGHQGGDQQNADDADRRGDDKGHGKGEQGVDPSVGDPRNHRAFLIEGQGKKLLVEQENHGQHQGRHADDPPQFTFSDGQDAAEQITGHVDVKSVGGADQDHAEADTPGKHHRDGQFLVCPV